MTVKDIQDETLQDYKDVAMLISANSCDWKCCREAGNNICQNGELAQRKSVTIPNEDIVQRYLANPISKAIIIGGLEPMLQFLEVVSLIYVLRIKNLCDDPVIIYTGYNKDELTEQIRTLKVYPNIIIKYGRFVPGDKPHYDPVLGIKLASNNQWAEKIS